MLLQRSQASPRPQNPTTLHGSWFRQDFNSVVNSIFHAQNKSFAGNTTAASNALCEQSCCLEEAPGKQQHPTQPACLPSRPNLNRDCWNISKRKFKNKNSKPLEPHAAAAAAAARCLRGRGAGPPSPSRLLLMHMHGCKLNVSRASSRRGPSLPRTKGGALGYSRHRLAGHRGGKGSPHTGMWQLQAGEAGEAEAPCQSRAGCSPRGAWMGLEAPVPLSWCCCSNHQHSHTRGMAVSILHP